MDIQELVKGISDCTCGKNHACPMDHVIIGKQALQSLGEICEGYQKILMISDQNTYQACGEKVAQILDGKIAAEVRFETGEEPLIPDECAMDTIREKMTDEIDLVLGVGSGVINDLCKIASFQRNLPYYIVATAPSMDGYASVGSALILKGMKVTLNAAPPKAIVADTDVLKQAPLHMLQAGYGDIIGKYSCLNDWKLSALINGEYFCQKVYDIAYRATEKVKELAERIVAREEEAVGELMKALVAVGIAMAYVGNSRPASGSEHHFSHYFEITGILNHTPYLSHGIDVVYASVLTAELREQLLKSTPKRREFQEENWKCEIQRIYSKISNEVVELQESLGWYHNDNSEKVLPKWEQICEILAEAPTKEEVLELVAKIGLDYDEFVKLYGEEKIADGLLYAKDLKDRYTILWLYYEFFR